MHHSPTNRVLVVEDDPASRSYLEIALARRGYGTLVAKDAEDAENQLTAANLSSFSCVITDYRMPGRTGLELLGWIKQHDPSLATILVTAESEKQLVAESLRGGAIDFLEKPIDPGTLEKAVARAIERTNRQRRMTMSESAAREIGRTQQRMLAAETWHQSNPINVCFYPKYEAGGDFFSQFRPAPDQWFCLLTDVSGHDLQAAYISAYFQGLVRGLLMRGAPIQEIFGEFNRYLLEEWNQDNRPFHPDHGDEVSVAACALLFDFSSRVATVFTHGTPAPVWFTADGAARVVGETGGPPLGWFPGFPTCASSSLAGNDGSFYLWTDGLEDLAERRDVSSLSLASSLLEAKRRQQDLPWIAEAADDILLVELQLYAGPPPGEIFRPLISERYNGTQYRDIDRLQSFWRRSLELAAPELPGPRVHDVLLASREAVLNALTHGCGGREDRVATFQMACCPASRTIRVSVSDPGPGHDFDAAQREREGGNELLEDHWGLIFLKHLATRLNFQRHGASVSMTFDW